jgi:cytoplasmic polyadenylation element-binding protein
MNELREKYDYKNYFLNKTRSVYLNLDGSMLRLQTTTSKVPKRAVCDENIGHVTFNQQRIYSLVDCQITILPAALCRKRYWSKKYPLCLTGVKLLSSRRTNDNNNNDKSSKVSLIPNSTSVNSHLNEETISIDSNDSINQSNLAASSFGQLDDDTLILFARTDREKEEWFKLFNRASAKKLLDSHHYSRKRTLTNQSSLDHTPTNSFNSDDLGQAQLKYNAHDKVIYSSLNVDLNGDETASNYSENNVLTPSRDKEKDKDREKEKEKERDKEKDKDNKKKILTSTANSVEVKTQTDSGLLYDSSLSFLNTFLIRAFADFFTHKHWLSKIENKLQNKLNKIQVPYFMEELEVVGLDAGCMIPLIKSAGEPWYDEKGLWVYLDIDYSGGLQISLSTKLNIMKLKAASSKSTGFFYFIQFKLNN